MATYLFSLSLFTALIIICLCVNVESVKETALNCAVQALKARNLLNQNFPLPYPRDDREMVDCDDAVRRVKKLFIRELSAKLDVEKGAYRKCIVDRLVSQNYTDYLWLEIIYDKSVEIYKRNEVANKMNLNVETTTFSCFFDVEFAEFFDILMEESKSWNNDQDFHSSLKFYCVRKIVEDQNLMDLKYGFKVNPKNISSVIKCKPFWFSEFDKWRKVLLRKLKSPSLGLDRLQFYKIVVKFRDFNFIGRFFLVGLLNDLKLTENDKDGERKKFVTLMSDSINQVIEEIRRDRAFRPSH